jgi:hypothetical protein
MKNRLGIVAIFLSIATLLTGCDLIGGVFKVGMWIGIIIVVLVIVLVLWLLRKIR